MIEQHERRAATRHNIEVPVLFNRGTGVSKDISLSGIYFITKELLTTGEKLNLSFGLEYAIPGKPLQLDCHGQVLRVETLDGGYGVAAKIEEVNYLH